MDIVPKLALEVVKAGLKIFSWVLQLYFIEVMLDFGLTDRLWVIDFACGYSLYIVEIGLFESVQLREIVLRKHNVLPVKSALELKESVPDGVD